MFYHISMDLKEILQLVGEQGKVVFVDENSEVKGILLSLKEYRATANISRPDSLTQPVNPQTVDLAEQVNKEILQALLEEVISSEDGGTATPLDLNPPERIDSLLSKRAQDLFKSIPNYTYVPPEVITSIDEEIKPNFDDI